MNDPLLQDRIKSVKSKIEKLIENGRLDEAKAALEQLNAKIPGDPEICSMQAVVSIIEGNPDKAVSVIEEGLRRDSVQFDLLFNLAYIREMEGRLQDAADLYSKAETVAYVDMQKQNVREAIERIKSTDESIEIKDKARIVFFVKAGMDNFLEDIILGLNDDYWVRKIIVSNLKQIDEGMEWADVCWFEWCDELVAYGSNRPLARRKKVMCRIHGYEVYTENINKVNWLNVDRLIIVAPHIKRLFLENIRETPNVDIDLIYCGVNVERYPLSIKKKGFNLGYLGYINFKKNIPLTLDIFKKLHDKDQRYELHIGGMFQDERTLSYYKYFIREHKLEDSVFFDGWQDECQKIEWLRKIDYMVISSIDEGLCFAAAEAMCSGIKAVLHNCEGIKDHYDRKYIFSTVDDAVEMISSEEYSSMEYREFIENNYSLKKQLMQINGLIKELLSFRDLVGRVKDILSGVVIPQELMREDITVLIPCYNRAKMIREDLEKGLKLGKQPKLIVDDCSTEETQWLKVISREFTKSGSRLIKAGKNGGVAETRRLGLEAIETEYTTFIDDDNMMVCLDRAASDKDILQLKHDASIVVPRYIINYYSDRLSLGYDRQHYNEMNGDQVLRELASSGEMMGLLTGGAIGETQWMSGHVSCPLFRASEDYVMLCRMMASKPEMKLRTTEGLVFIRRFLDEGLTLNPTPLKLMLGLFSQAIACYYCLQLGVADKDEVLKWMKDRAALIQQLYDFGESFETELIAYLTGEISEEVFVHFIELHGLKLENGLDELAPELRMMRAMFYNELKAEKWFTGMKDLPLVSIIIPTFNRRDMLKRAIDQMLKQDYPNFEVIITDNCSDDGTEEMVRSNYRDEKRVIYHRNETNIGPVLNYQNALYLLSKGKYCIMMSDDDYMVDSHYIGQAVRVMEENNDLAFVFSGYYYNHELKQTAYRVLPDYPSKINGAELFLNFTRERYNYMPNLCTTLFRRENALRVDVLKCDPNCLAVDLSMLLKLLLTGDTGFIRSIALTYTLHKGSISLNPEHTVTNDQSKIQKVVESAVQDINEMINISKLAMQYNIINNNNLKEWLDFRIWKYMYWRFNETVHTIQECKALINFMQLKYPSLMKMLKGLVINRFGQNVLEGIKL